MFEVTVEQTFAAGHSLRNYHGKCENVHGHNYRVRVTMEGRQLDGAGLLVDFVEVKRRMQTVIDRLDHRYINDIPPFDVLNPSAENMARYFHEELSLGIADASARIAEVRVWETDITAAAYRP
ncbi:MAG: 6-carboxytetrahydropterin synthase QueD [Bryobacteraceae bacterium]